jgi:menaquinol-cytochrome c reductase iron-sulfur subunit
MGPSRESLEMSDQRGQDDSRSSRRRFLIRVMTVLGGAIAAVLAIPVVGFITAPGWQAKTPPKLLSTSVAPTLRSDECTSIGKDPDFEVGVPKFVEVERHIVDGWVTETVPIGIQVVRTTDADLVVFDPHCTHLGCPVSWSSGAGAFLCPCHGGSFTSTGDVASGPPPRPMIRYETRTESGEVFIGSFLADGT